MSSSLNHTPTFVTGARAKLKVDGKTIAYATDVQYQVEVQHAPVDVMGAYETIAYEPLGYKVRGKLTVVRYTKAPNTPAAQNATTEGNSVNAPEWNTGAAGPEAAFNPVNLVLSRTFDIEVHDKRQGATTEGVKFIHIVDARFESRGGGINARGLMQEEYSFNGILMQDEVANVTRSHAAQA